MEEAVFVMILISLFLKHSFELLIPYVDASIKGTKTTLPMPTKMAILTVYLKHSSCCSKTDSSFAIVALSLRAIIGSLHLLTDFNYYHIMEDTRMCKG